MPSLIKSSEIKIPLCSNLVSDQAIHYDGLTHPRAIARLIVEPLHVICKAHHSGEVALSELFDGVEERNASTESKGALESTVHLAQIPAINLHRKFVDNF